MSEEKQEPEEKQEYVHEYNNADLVLQPLGGAAWRVIKSRYGERTKLNTGEEVQKYLDKCRESKGSVLVVMKLKQRKR